MIGGPVRMALAALAPLVLLAACQKADNEPGPGGVSVGEAKALDRAAAMIEDQPPPAADPGPAATETAKP